MKTKEHDNKMFYAISILVKWRDEVTEKKKARAIQRVIDKKLRECDKLDMIWLEITEKVDGIKLSAW